MKEEGISLFSARHHSGEETGKMHHLFSLVLNVKDLSKAGELFSLPDELIMDNISEILIKVREITASVGYTQNDNDQSVVEITLSRITATLRETNCIEDHIDALVDLLKTCLNHDLKPLPKDMDPPHAKIASDVLTSIFLNYTKRNVMKQSIPIAVKFLHKGNRELTRNVSSYLPLAAIEHPDLVVEHIQPIIDSVIGGNYSLAKVFPHLYPLNPERVNEHLMALANILSLCDDSEKTCLLNLLRMVASSNPAVTVPLLEPSLPQLLDCLNDAETIGLALEVLLEMARECRLLQDHLEVISYRTSSRGSAPLGAMILSAKLFAEIGRHTYHEKATQCLNKMVNLVQQSSQDPATQMQVLHEVVTFTQSRPTILNTAIINRIQRYVAGTRGLSSLIDKLWDVCSHRNITVVNIRDNDQMSSTTTAASSSTELLLNTRPTSIMASPTYSTIKPSYRFSGMGNTSNLVNRIHISNSSEFKQQRAAATSSGALNSSQLLPISPIKPQNFVGFRHPYGSQPSTAILHQQSHAGTSPSISNTSHYKSLNRLPAGVITGEYKKRTALVSPYQNRSISSSIGLQDDFPISGGGLKSIRNSQTLGNYGVLDHTPKPHVNSAMINHLANYGAHTSNRRIENNHLNHHIYAVQPQQNLSLLKNYFSTNSGTLSSTASIHAMTNTFGSRSATHLAGNHSHNHTTFPTLASGKGLPSPNRTSQESSPLQQSYHYSQPELRHRANNNQDPSNSPDRPDNTNNRISVFEPFPMRDTILHFCEKHLDKIKSYMEKACVKIPLPVKCTIEERKSKKSAKLHFSCQCRTSHCLYVNNRLFTMKTRHPRIWIHLMFLALQARSTNAMSSRDSSVTSLKNCWDTLKAENKSFLAIVTSAFPSARDQELLTSELRNAGFSDLFEFNALKSSWGCFFCNYPSRAMEFLSSEEPILEGCLKEKKGKWRLFKRWRTRYFTLSGGQLQAKGSDSSSTLNLHQILSLRVTRGQRSIPKAFEIFTEEKKIVLKPKDGKNASEWVQCLSVLVAQKAAAQRDENLEASMYTGHYSLGSKGNSCSMSALRTEV